jgi:ketosteroid isomerase-like protein
MSRSPESLARRYYVAVDAGAYDDLRSLLTSSFVHYRPDRTLEGRAAFVRFMREDRPRKDTAHAVDRVATDGDDGVAVVGRLRADGTDLFGFVDVFETRDGRLASLRTFA